MNSNHVVKTTIALDESVHRALRHLAIEEKSSAQQLMVEAVSEMLERRAPKLLRITEATRNEN